MKHWPSLLRQRWRTSVLLVCACVHTIIECIICCLMESYSFHFQHKVKKSSDLWPPSPTLPSLFFSISTYFSLPLSPLLLLSSSSTQPLDFIFPFREILFSQNLFIQSIHPSQLSLISLSTCLFKFPLKNVELIVKICLILYISNFWHYNYITILYILHHFKCLSNCSQVNLSFHSWGGVWSISCYQWQATCPQSLRAESSPSLGNHIWTEH